MSIKRHLAMSVLTLACFLPQLTAAAPHYGANFSTPLITKEPMNLHGYQLMLNYDPDRFKWHQFNLYFDGGFSHFWMPHSAHNSTINIYSAAPVVRYTFSRSGYFLPYFEFSIGLSYLNQTRIDSRNLGIHFAFQDRLGIGTLLGQSERVSLGVHAVHYSNAHLSAHNSGITVPLALDIGYRF